MFGISRLLTSILLLKFVLYGLLLVGSFFVRAEEVIELEGIFVRGNQEQPKVLFIMPWQTDAELSGLKQEIKPDLHARDEYLDYFDFKRKVDTFYKDTETSSQK
ncbi:hypothetical protein [Litoribrevibacter albus]|uniref:Uncharacterized protein n=1 Tax=Litoribrevibacter albus TaxID=1473156 RepID=A0AA37W4W7_9GAMM|nr:hypothetical protein [Litoribrevibacter albus]GLQ30055.1 hypothetical protein GCM10007876_05330 [Litoribrevibacter albus]